MPVSNDSQIWPKILICKECHAPVEEGVFKESKIASYHYSCPTCDVLVPPQKVEWVKNVECA